jgi:hypothetical protein
VSDDGGKSFRLYGNLCCENPRHFIEPRIVELSNGSLVLLSREWNGGWLRKSVSHGAGETWLELQRTDIPNPASKITLLCSKDGRIFLLHNCLTGTTSITLRGGFDDMLRWRISPEEYREVAKFVKEWMDLQPDDALGSKILLLDNWAEWGEGHYIAPYQEYGFEYLDVIRDVLTTEDKQHVDVIPDEISLGPYDSPYTEKPEHRVFKYPPLPALER